MSDQYDTIPPILFDQKLIIERDLRSTSDSLSIRPQNRDVGGVGSIIVDINLFTEWGGG